MPELVSKASICNDALVLLGQPRLISDAEAVQDYGHAATVVGAYDGRLETLLRSSRWGFARKRVALDAHTDAPAFGFAYRYALPSDCLAVWRLDDVKHGLNPIYTVEDGFVLTDEAAKLNVIYIRHIADPQELPADFRTALARAIADECALAVLGSHEAVAAYEKRKKGEAADAYANDLQENRRAPRELFEETWLTGRSTG